jgi:hypothetical protein
MKPQPIRDAMDRAITSKCDGPQPIAPAHGFEVVAAVPGGDNAGAAPSERKFTLG